MKAAALLILLVLATPAASNPVAKVLQMLSDLQAKILAEGQEAQKVYEEFAEYCEDRSKNIGFEVKTGKSEVADLTATIDSEAGKISALEAKIEETAAAISVDEKDLKAATEIRETEAADFSATEKDLVETIDILERAISILERELAKGASMLQLQKAGTVVEALKVLVGSAALGAADAKRLTALVQGGAEEDADDAALGAPDPAAYKSKSGDIVATLEGLLDKAKSQLGDARKEETANLHNFEMLKQGLEDEIKFSEKELAEAKKALAAASEAKAAAEGDLAVTDKKLQEDIKVMATLHKDCMTKASDFEAETKSRGEELEALAQAKKIISEATSGASDITYVQESGEGDVSLLQVGRHQQQLTSTADLVNFEALRLIRDLARKQKSKALAQLASRMSSAIRYGSTTGDDPFAKVKELIKDMLERLIAEGEAEAKQKAYCDKEMAESNAKKEDKTAEIAKLNAAIDQMTARSAQLKNEVAALQKQLADLAAAQAEMDKVRQEEHDLYSKNRPEMEQGIEGVKMALKILREYYAKEDKAHASAEGAGAGIIGLLEVVESDFTKGLAEMISTEEASAADYDRETKANEIQKTTTEQDVKYKTKEFTGLDQSIAESTSDRAGVQEELDAVLEYLKKLEDICIAKPESYEERKARREAELAGLREALEILSGESVLLERKASLRRFRGPL